MNAKETTENMAPVEGQVTMISMGRIQVDGDENPPRAEALLHDRTPVKIRRGIEIKQYHEYLCTIYGKNGSRSKGTPKNLNRFGGQPGGKIVKIKLSPKLNKPERAFGFEVGAFLIDL